MEKAKVQSDEWIRMASKSHPGRFYLFNKATGETQWLPSATQYGAADVQRKEAPPKFSKSKTPAQDRLKRLQHNLKVRQKNDTLIASPAMKDISAKEVQNVSKDEPSTSIEAKKESKSSNKESDLCGTAHLSSAIESPKKNVKPLVLDTTKELNLSILVKDETSNSTSNHSVIKASTEISQPIKEMGSNNIVRNIEEISVSKLQKLRSGIVRKIKEICKIPFLSISKKSTDENLVSTNENLPSIKKTTNFKATQMTKTNKLSSGTAVKEAIINQIRDEKCKPLENKILTSTLNTVSNSSIPSYPKGSANSRLERLKKSLLLQQQAGNTTNINDIFTSKVNTAVRSENNNNIKTALQDGNSRGPSEKNYIKSTKNTADSSINNEVEAMDWQPIVKDKVSAEQSPTVPTLVVQKSRKCLLESPKGNEVPTMGEILDTVNENLLRFSAEKQKLSNNKWRKDFYYIIADTNVFISELSFIEDLTNMKLCDTNGTMLYVPYTVLQELDKLKMCYGSKEAVKTQAVRAIKYLNSKFENKSPHLQAQSALEERNHLIDINSPDDSIINCCLQAKENVENLLLLTGDANLRNKAICNNIIVSTKSDLVAKRYDSTDKS